jgi:transcriptional regulator with XRE-family HTH domain
MTQQKLAEETGMDRAYLVNAVGGWVNVSFLNLCRLAAALGVDTGSLVSGIERTGGTRGRCRNRIPGIQARQRALAVRWKAKPSQLRTSWSEKPPTGGRGPPDQSLAAENLGLRANLGNFGRPRRPR